MVGNKIKLIKYFDQKLLRLGIIKKKKKKKQKQNYKKQNHTAYRLNKIKWNKI